MTMVRLLQAFLSIGVFGFFFLAAWFGAPVNEFRAFMVGVVAGAFLMIGFTTLLTL